MANLSAIITPTNVVAVAPGANGNVLTSNGTAWVSQTPSGGAPSLITMVSPGDNGVLSLQPAPTNIGII